MHTTGFGRLLRRGPFYHNSHELLALSRSRTLRLLFRAEIFNAEKGAGEGKNAGEAVPGDLTKPKQITG